MRGGCWRRSHPVRQVNVFGILGGEFVVDKLQQIGVEVREHVLHIKYAELIVAGPISCTHAQMVAIQQLVSHYICTVCQNHWTSPAALVACP